MLRSRLRLRESPPSSGESETEGEGRVARGAKVGLVVFEDGPALETLGGGVGRLAWSWWLDGRVSMGIGRSIIKGPMVRAEGRLWEGETCSSSVERSNDVVVSKGCVSKVMVSCRVEKSTGVRVAEEESVVVVAVVEFEESQADVAASRASKSIS